MLKSWVRVYKVKGLFGNPDLESYLCHLGERWVVNCFSRISGNITNTFQVRRLTGNDVSPRIRGEMREIIRRLPPCFRAQVGLPEE